MFAAMEVLLDVYKYPAVAETASGCDIDRDVFLIGYDGAEQPVDNTVFVFAPERRQDQLRPLLEAFICWLIRGAEDPYAATGIAPLRKLGTYASSLASQGVQLVAVFQNFGQVRDRCGIVVAGTLASRPHSTKLGGHIGRG